MGKSFYLLIFLLPFSSCKERANEPSPYNVRCDIRLDNKFYSILLSEGGNAYVIRGKGSFYAEPFRVESSDTSKVFKLDSVGQTFEIINRIKSNPVFRESRTTGLAPRAEVYYDNHKVYDGYAWDDTYWDIFRPIMEQIPKGFNPFRVSDDPF